MAGTGLRDTSRLADSDPALWAEIVAANPRAVAAALRAVVDPLTGAGRGARGSGSRRSGFGGRARTRTRGRDGRELLAGKHGRGGGALGHWSRSSVPD